MSEKTPTQLQKIIADKLQAYPNKSPKEIAQEINEDPDNIKARIHTTTAYVYKRKGIFEKQPQLFEKPEIHVEEPAETPEGEEAEEGETEEHGEEEVEEWEEPDGTETPKEPVAPEKLEEEQKKYQPIFLRAMDRLEGTFSEYGDVDLKGDSQENKDTQVLVFGLASKYLNIMMENYYLEATAIVHFGNIFARTMLRKKEKERIEKAKNVTPEKPEKAEPMKTEDKPEETKEKIETPKTPEIPQMEEPDYMRSLR